MVNTLAAGCGGAAPAAGGVGGGKRVLRRRLPQGDAGAAPAHGPRHLRRLPRRLRGPRAAAPPLRPRQAGRDQVALIGRSDWSL